MSFWFGFQALKISFGMLWALADNIRSSVKKDKNLSFSGTKICLKEKLRLQTTIFLEILRAVCRIVDWVPKLIQKSFQTMEQKYVQRCETKVVVDACNASY